MRIAEVLRARAAKIEGKDVFFPDHKHICLSACVIMSAGGVERNLSNIGLHRTHVAKRLKGAEYEYLPNSDDEQAYLADFYAEMGLPKELFEEQMKVPFDQLREINIDLDAPFEGQEIVRLGFRTRKPDQNEIASLRLIDKQFTQSSISLEYAGKLNDVYAASVLGRRYFNGLNGEDVDIEKGLFWLNRAAELGSISTIHYLGVIYTNGYQGVPVDKPRAVEYLKKSANLGLAGSQNNLGWMYYVGEGAEKSLSEAIFWITRAIDQGDAFAYDSLSEIRFDGNGFARDDIETYKWTKLGHSFLPNGRTKEKNDQRLQRLSERMTEEQIKTAESLAASWKPLNQTSSSMRDKEDN